MLKIILLATGLTAASIPGMANAGSYEDAFTFFNSADSGAGMTVGQLEDALNSLTQQFNAICGDTFCEGDYSNITSLSIDCSVNVTTKQVAQCIWTFAGSNANIDQDTGLLSIDKQVFECDLGVKGSATDLANFFRSATKTDGTTAGLTGATVPGAGTDLMTVLGGCL